MHKHEDIVRRCFKDPRLFNAIMSGFRDCEITPAARKRSGSDKVVFHLKWNQLEQTVDATLDILIINGTYLYTISGKISNGHRGLIISHQFDTEYYGEEWCLVEKLASILKFGMG